MNDNGVSNGRIKSALLVIPRLGHLLFCLIKDSRVPFSKKLALAGGLVYFIFPTDLIPESRLPHLGLVDDLIVLIRVLRSILVDLDSDIIQEHWKGTAQELKWVQHAITRGDDAIVGIWNEVVCDDTPKSIAKV